MKSRGRERFWLQKEIEEIMKRLKYWDKWQYKNNWKIKCKKENVGRTFKDYWKAIKINIFDRLCTREAEVGKAYVWAYTHLLQAVWDDEIKSLGFFRLCGAHLSADLATPFLQ